MRYAILIAALLAATRAWSGEVTVSEAWARATAPGQTNGAVYLHITSGRDARITAVSSAAAGRAEMHSMTHEKGVMKMRELEAVPLPGGKTVKLGSGGSHIMLIGLKQPLKADDSVPLTLTVEFSGKRTEMVKVNATVVPLAPKPHQHHDH